MLLGQFASCLRLRDFRVLWVGSTVSLVGDALQTVVLPALVLSMIGNSSGWAAVVVALSVPRAALMLLGGLLVDRIRPQAVLIRTQFLLGVQVSIFGILAATGSLELWHVYALSLVYGVLSAFSIPAGQSVVPELVGPDQVRPANALMVLTSNVVRSVVPPVAGVVAAVGAAEWLFFANAASFLISVAFLRTISSSSSTTTGLGSESALQQIKDGMRAARADPPTSAIILVSIFFFASFAGVTWVGLPVFAKLALIDGDRGLGLLYGAAGLGALLGAAVVGMSTHIPRQGYASCLAMAGAGAAVATVAGADSPLSAAPLLVAAHFLGSVATLIVFSAVQVRTPPEVRGRVVSLLTFGMFGLYPLAYAMAGIAGDFVGPRQMMLIGGMVTAVPGLYGLLRRDLAKL